MHKTYTLGQLADYLSADLRGDSAITITSIAPLQAAQAGQISFLDNPKYRRFLPQTQATAVILSADFRDKAPCATLTVTDPYVAYAKLATLFNHVTSPAPSIHATVIQGNDCQIADDVFLGPNVVLGDNVHIGQGTVIHAGCIIGDNVRIGDNTTLWPNVVVYHGVEIGHKVTLHSGAVIGSDGFGYAFHEAKWLKIPQIGAVIIGDEVEVGANTTIDRGALAHTIIEKGVKLDNQIQVGHNAHIGAYTIIAGCTAIAGSTIIGKYCRIGGLVGIAGHLTIADQVVISGMSGVSSSIREAGTYSSGMPVTPNIEWRKNSIRFQQLDALARKVAALEQQLSHLQEDTN